MKYEAKSKAMRLDVSIAELQVLVRLAELGCKTSHAATMRRHDLIQPLLDGLRNACRAQQEKVDQARRDAADRLASGKMDDSRRKNLTVEGHTVMATFGDYIDIAPSIDFNSWMPLAVMEARGKLPMQAELRRDVWNVVVLATPEQRAADDTFITIGGDCTEDDNPLAIVPLALDIIRKASPR